ncbi:MAG: FAD-dependent oxidoreductase [Marmoricola sp.]
MNELVCFGAGGADRSESRLVSIHADARVISSAIALSSPASREVSSTWIGASRSRVGARPMTASGRPIVRRASPTTVVVTGHGTLGITLAPRTGELVLQPIVG